MENKARRKSQIAEKFAAHETKKSVIERKNALLRYGFR